MFFSKVNSERFTRELMYNNVGNTIFSKLMAQFEIDQPALIPAGDFKNKSIVEFFARNSTKSKTSFVVNNKTKKTCLKLDD